MTNKIRLETTAPAAMRLASAPFDATFFLVEEEAEAALPAKDCVSASFVMASENARRRESEETNLSVFATISA